MASDAARVQRRLQNLPLAPAGPARWAFRQCLRYAAHRAALTFFLTIFAQGAALGTSILLARTMALETYGEYLYALSWGMLVAQIGILGFDRLAIREVAANLARKDLATLHGFLRFVLKWEMSIIVVGAVVAWGIARLLQHAFDLAIPNYIGWAMLTVPPMVLLNLQMGLVRGTDHVVASQIPEKLLRPAGFLIGVGLMLLMFGSPSVPALFAAYGISALLGSCWAWRDMKRFIPSLPASTQPVCRSREWLVSSLHLSTVVLMFTINARADSLLLGMLDGAGAVAVYLVALRISQSTSLAVGVFNVLLGPNISSRHALGDQAGLQRLAGRYARAILAVNLLTVLPVILFCKPLVGLFGASFLPSATPLVILCLGQLANGMAGPAGNFLINCGQEALSAKILTFTCALNVAMNMALIPPFGATGAAVAASASLLIKTILLVWACVSRLRINPTPLALKALSGGSSFPSPRSIGPELKDAAK
jgi:O-antigen/teichoic acid export membrane protein